MLAAAIRLLDDRPDTTLAEIAAGAGVTRQTVYAHFGARRDLLVAVMDLLTHDYLAALDAAELDQGSAIEALSRFVEVGRSSMRLNSTSAHTISAALDPAESQARHVLVLDRLIALARRGQDSGEFDDEVPADWLAAATISLSHTAAAENAAGRLTTEQAEQALHRSLMHLYGIARNPI